MIAEKATLQLHTRHTGGRQPGTTDRPTDRLTDQPICVFRRRFRAGRLFDVVISRANQAEGNNADDDPNSHKHTVVQLQTTTHCDAPPKQKSENQNRSGLERCGIDNALAEKDRRIRTTAPPTTRTPGGKGARKQTNKQTNNQAGRWTGRQAEGGESTKTGDASSTPS